MGAGLYEAGGVQVSADRGDGDFEAVVVLQVPGDGEGPASTPLPVSGVRTLSPLRM